jgi:hypothetical protein
MKKLAVVSGICASFLLGGALSALAQEERHEEKQEEKHEARQEERHEQEHRRIADEHFRQHFGREHHFAVKRVTVVEGRPRFEYGGYRFEIAQPWPGGWAYTDDCYIDSVDGEYYMFNLRHPGVRVAVTVLP